MRLDGLGKPALVQSDRQDSVKVQEKKISRVAPVERQPDSGTSFSRDQGAKLGQILDILQMGQEKKKKKPLIQKAAGEVIRLYQRQLIEESENQVGQTLDLKG